MIIHLRTRGRRFVSNAAVVVGSFAVAVAMNIAAPAAAKAQSLEVLYYFSGAPDDGAHPGPLIQATDGNFYGTTWGGGPADAGTIFQLTPDGQMTILHAFTGDDGWNPGSLLQASDGNFYGIVNSGSTATGPVMFRMTPDGTVADLYPTNSCTGPFIQATDGNFYGTRPGDWAFYPYTYTDGLVTRLTPDGTSCTVLHDFTGYGSDGQNPSGLIQASNGMLYMTTFYGGGMEGWGPESGNGTVFAITLGAAFRILHSFSGPQEATDGKYPEGPLVQANDGNLYGTTSQGGPLGFGTAFRVTADGAFTVLNAFTQAIQHARLFLQASDGNFYGAGIGAPSTDTIFQLTPDGTLNVVYTFNGYPDPWQVVGLVQGSDGKLYGTASYGGAGASPGDGVVFRLTLPGMP